MKHLIQRQVDLSNVGVILLNQSTIEAIRELSGPLASTCEYQVHYWALVARIPAEDGSVMDICIPTVFFNYKQEVNGAHIDFELSDVNLMSDKLEPVHNVMVNKLMQSDFISNIRYLIDNVEFMSVPMNTLHKHPGESSHQSFSSTDFSTNHLHNTGIVFPLASAINQPSFSGIMAHDSSENHIAHFEYRIADGTIDFATDSSIIYSRGRCLAHISDTITTVSMTEKLIGIEPELQSYCTLSDMPESAPYGLFTTITDLWDASPILPMTDFIDPTNISRKTYNTPMKPFIKSRTTSSNTYDRTTVAKAIEWITPIDLSRMSLPQLVKAVTELDNFYYEHDEELDALQQSSVKACIEEYEFFRESIIDELNEELLEQKEEAEYRLLLGGLDDDDDEQPAYLMRNEEITFMEQCLIVEGVLPAKVATMSSKELLTAYQNI